MKIGVISDTHDRLPTFRRAVALFKRLRVDAVLHAGDLVAPFAAKLVDADALAGIPLHVCYGNNDGERDGLKKVLPQIIDGPVHLQLGGKRIVMHHFIDWLKPPDYTAPDGRPIDITVSGHNHEHSIDIVDHPTVAGHRVLKLNPGECCGWVNDRPTVALLDTDQPLESAAEIIEVHD